MMARATRKPCGIVIRSPRKTVRSIGQTRRFTIPASTVGCKPLKCQTRASDFEQILAKDDATAKMHSGRVDPHVVCDCGIIRGNQMREHERLDASGLGHTTGVLG